MNGLANLLIRHLLSIWHDDQLIVIIIQTVNDGDATTSKLLQRRIDPENIRIQLPAVWRFCFRYKAIVHWINISRALDVLNREDDPSQS